MDRIPILVVDDDLSMREFLELMLTREGYDVRLAGDGRQALALAEKTPFELVITDIRMEGLDGIDVLRGIKALKPDTVVILISAFASVETAVMAMREGAHDFIPKPFNIDDLKGVLQNALANRTPEAERAVLTAKVKAGCHFGSLCGLSSAMQKVYDLVRRAAQTATNILITGESGTGKELVARAIHDNSPRADRKFVAINCGGMPEQLIESELFGYRKGAFTGASADKPGLFEAAHKGTLFLDELAELSMAMQVKLLRAVQEKTIRAVGGAEEKPVDVRIIAATNKDLETEVIAGRFREDLYYRLNVINIHMPPLRERKSDIALLAQFFLEKYSKAMGKDVRKISLYALDILQNYEFPGNVRELENIIERSVALEQSNIILPESLTLSAYKRRRLNGVPAGQPGGPGISAPMTPPPGPAPFTPLLTSLDEMLEQAEKYYLVQALNQADGIRGNAAKLLGISLWRLRGRLNKHNLGDLDPVLIMELTQFPKPEFKLPPELLPDWTGRPIDLDRIILDMEKFMLDEAITQSDGSKTKAAERLRISLRTLQSRLARSEAEPAL